MGIFKDQLICSRLESVSHALGTGTDRRVRSWENSSLWFGVLLDFGEGIDDTADKSDSNGRDTGEGDWVAKEHETGQGNWELVEGSNHGVSSGGGNTNAPCGGVGDENSRQSGEEHGDVESVTGIDRKVLGYIGARPVLNEERANHEDGNGEKVIVEHS